MITINGVEYANVRARFVGVTNSGIFEFRILEVGQPRDAKWGLPRCLKGQEPASGYFGLPEYDGRTICPDVHTVRLRLGFARAQRIL